MLERGAELKEKCSQRAFLSHGTSGVFLRHARLHWGAPLAPGAVLKCKFAVVDLFCRLTRPCVDRYHVSTTSLPRLKGNQPWRRIPSQPGNSLKLPSAVEAGRKARRASSSFCRLSFALYCKMVLPSGTPSMREGATNLVSG